MIFISSIGIPQTLYKPPSRRRVCRLWKSQELWWESQSPVRCRLASRVPAWLRECQPAVGPLGGSGLPGQGSPARADLQAHQIIQWGPYPRLPRLESYNGLSSPSQSALQERMAMAVARYVTVWTTLPVTTSPGPVTAAQDGRGRDVIKVRMLVKDDSSGEDTQLKEAEWFARGYLC